MIISASIRTFSPSRFKTSLAASIMASQPGFSLVLFISDIVTITLPSASVSVLSPQAVSDIAPVASTAASAPAQSLLTVLFIITS